MSHSSFIAFEDYLRSEKRASEKTIVAYSTELQRWASFLEAEFEVSPEKALGPMLSGLLYGVANKA